MSQRILYGDESKDEDDKEIKLTLKFPESIRKEIIQSLNEKENEGIVFRSKDERTEVSILIEG